MTTPTVYDIELSRNSKNALEVRINDKLQDIFFPADVIVKSYTAHNNDVSFQYYHRNAPDKIYFHRTTVI